MLKSRLGHSVWESFVSRFARSNRLARKARRSLRTDLQKGGSVESLEQRIVPAGTSPVVVSFSDATSTLTLTGGAGNQTVAVKAGASFTDVLVNGTNLTRLNGVDATTISTISFNGGGGTGDQLSVSGISTALTVSLTGVEKLQLDSGDTTVTSDAGVALLTSNVAGTLSLTATPTGNVTQTGPVNVNGTTTITATAGNIILGNASNSFGTLVLDGNTVTINEAGPTNFGNTTVDGAFTVTSNDKITNSGTLVVTHGASANTITSNGNSISLSGAFTGTGKFVLKGTDVTLTDSVGDIDLATVTATGSLTVTGSEADAGVTHSSGNITVAGLATITAGASATRRGDITLTAGSNNFGAVALSGRTISVTEKSSTSITSLDATENTGGVIAGGGNFILTSSGAVSDTGDVNVAGTTLLTAKGSEIKLDSTGNTFGGSVTFTGTNVTLSDDDAATVLAATVSTAKGDFTLNTAGPVTQTTNLLVSGRATVTTTNDAITLTDAANKFGSISFDGAVVQLREADATDLFTSTASGNFTLNSGGAVTDSGILDILGTTTINAAAGKSIILDEQSSFAQTIALTGKDAALVNMVASDLGNTTLTGNYTLQSFGEVTQTAATAISVTGRMTIDADVNDITLGDGAKTANFGSLAITTTTAGGAVTIDEDSDTNLYNTNVTGNFTLTSTGAVTDSGDLFIAGTTDIDAATTITLDSKYSTFTDGATDLILDGTNVSVADHDGNTSLGATTATGTLTISATGTITDVDVISVTGKATFNANGSDISINESGSTYSSSISLYGNDVVLDVDTVSVSLGTSKVASLDLDTSGALSQVGTVTSFGVTDINAATTITLTTASNFFGTLRLVGTDASIKQTGNADLGVSTVDSLSVIAAGGISDSGVLTVDGGTTTLTANGGDIELTNAGSTFGGGTLNLKGSNITLTDAEATDDTVLGNVVTGGNFTLTASDDVSQTGAAVTVGGIAIVTTTLATKDITLNGAANNFDSIKFTGRDVLINENSATDIEGGSAANDELTITSAGNITGLGIVTAGGITTLTAGAGTSLIDLSQTGSQFGDLEVHGSTVTINDANATKLLDTTTVTGTFTLISGGNVTQDAGDVVVGGLFAIKANAGASNIVLTSAGNEFFSVAVIGNDVSITDSTGDIDLASSVEIGEFTVNGDFTLIADGSVTDSSKLTINGVGKITNITSTNGDITLDEVDSTFRIIVLVGANVELNSYSALTLGTAALDITSSGTLTIRSFNGANITQDGASAIVAQYNAYISAEGMLTLNSGLANTFNGAINEFFSNGNLVSF